MGERIKNLRSAVKGLSLAWKVFLFFLALGAAVVIVPRVYALLGGGPSAEIQRLQDSVAVLLVDQATKDSLRAISDSARVAERAQLDVLGVETTALRGRNAAQDATIGALRNRVRKLQERPPITPPTGTASDSVGHYQIELAKCTDLSGARGALADSLTVSCAIKDSILAKRDRTVNLLAQDTTRLVESLAQSDSIGERWKATSIDFARATKCGKRGEYILGVCRLPWYVEVALIVGGTCWATHCLSGEGEKGPQGEPGPEGPPGPGYPKPDLLPRPMARGVTILQF